MVRRKCQEGKKGKVRIKSKGKGREIMGRRMEERRGGEKGIRKDGSGRGGRRK